LFFYTAISGVAVRTGLRQSMPSSSMDNCARVSATLPSCVHGKPFACLTKTAFSAFWQIPGRRKAS